MDFIFVRDCMSVEAKWIDVFVSAIFAATRLMLFEAS